MLFRSFKKHKAEKDRADNSRPPGMNVIAVGEKNRDQIKDIGENFKWYHSSFYCGIIGEKFEREKDGRETAEPDKFEFY